MPGRPAPSQWPYRGSDGWYSGRDHEYHSFSGTDIEVSPPANMTLQDALDDAAKWKRLHGEALQEIKRLKNKREKGLSE